MRRSFLAQFPIAAPITAFVSGQTFYTDLARERPALTVVPLQRLAAGAPMTNLGNVIVDGIEFLDDPAAALRALRAAPGIVRIFALIGNAAYAPTLAAFVAGGRLAAARPLVEADIDAIFAETGWQAAERVPLVDRALVNAAVPYAITSGGVTFTVATHEMGARLSAAGYFVIAEPR